MSIVARRGGNCQPRREINAPICPTGDVGGGFQSVTVQGERWNLRGRQGGWGKGVAASRRPATRKTPASVPTGACRESASCAGPSGTRRCFTDNAIFRRAPPFLPCRDARRRGCCAAAAAPKNGQEKPLHIPAVLLRQDKGTNINQAFSKRRRGRKGGTGRFRGLVPAGQEAQTQTRPSRSSAGAGRATQLSPRFCSGRTKRHKHKLESSLKWRRDQKDSAIRLRGVAPARHEAHT